MKNWKALALGLIASICLFVAPAAADCSQSATITVTAGATTEIVALASGRQIRICGFTITQATAGSFKFVHGTGSNCGTGTTDLTAAMVLPTNGSISNSAGTASLFRAPPSNALCGTAATGNVTGFVSYGRG